MRVSIIKENNIENFDLPKRVYGNYWIKDLDKNGDSRNLVNIEAINNKWIIKSNFEVKIKYNGEFVEKSEVNIFSFYELEINGEEKTVLLYSCPVFDLSYNRYQITNTNEINIGKNNTNHIVYSKDIIPNECVKITNNNSIYYLQTYEKTNIYINNKRVKGKTELKIGDVIFIYGLKIIIMKDFVVINNPSKLVTFNVNNLKPLPPEEKIMNYDELESIDELLTYDKKDYFYKSPRFREEVEEVTINIDPPPQKEPDNEMPLIYTLGPMVTMGMTSVVSGYSSLANIAKGQSTIGENLPTLIMTGAMLATMIFWPMLLQNYEKRKRKKNEKKRQLKYSNYIDEKRKLINNTILKQKQILTDNSISLKECQDIIVNKKRNLWERNIEHSDFLNVRIGTGIVKPSIDIKYPEEHFTMDDDNLQKYLDKLIEESKDMENCPINVSLIEKNITAVVGSDELTKKFLDGLILQIVTFHSYDDVKIVLLTDEKNKYDWEYMKNLPHTWSDDKNVRFYGNNTEDVKQLTIYLNEELNFRNNHFEEDDKLNYLSFQPYYIIIIDSLKIVRTNEFIKKLLEQKNNLGFTILIRNDKLSNLPNECSTFINIDKQTSGIFENELVSDKQKEFVANIEDVDMEKCALELAKIPIETKNSKIMLPNTVGFLEMYNVGMIEQLNILNRWEKNNPTISLEAPVGIDENGDLFNLNLHEKAHGPHGLIAGMTGSGKSEFIITYILSMAINYHPDEVQFVLIDYKGGGLAGAFENRETGVKLPHLIGTITNLDTTEMNRSLASIQSELKRRQQIFNEARDSLNESTVDIYKYQRFYREGKVKRPVSHLFIISDEFAELKVQQPDFMDQLISTARIGRSLGVHLILATQKPSGVVDDQIWSNSKFRVCLKVQEKQDSMDMIKCPDAASLKNVGRFYLQVGYNEIFAIGQSAWAGAQYRKTEKIKKKIDTTINFINNIGYTIKSIDEDKKNIQGISLGEELPNIVKFIYELGKKENIKTDKLWLDKIDQFITINNLSKKYNYHTSKFIINPIIGEYDIPKNQQQNLLTLPLSQNGNTICYGAAGSGKELLLSTIIYSTIIYHSAEEVNFYILDFGSESLKMYIDAPQIGDVITSIDEEKINNLFKMIDDIIEERKRLFVDYNGNYDSYCKYSGKTIPTIIVIINQYESFSELYDEQFDNLNKYTREGFKYGVIFILSVSGVNNITYKLQQNFKQSILLQLNDEMDYSSIIGNTHGLFPSKLEGRGLVKLDDIYEFQTASITQPDKLSDYIKEVCKKLKQALKVSANKIPILPNIVNFEFVKEYITDMSNLPVGVDKNSLKVVNYNFTNRLVTMIISQEIENTTNFIFELIEIIKTIKNNQLIIIDATNIFDNNETNFNNYFNKDLNSIYEKIKEYISQATQNNNMPKTTCIIIGLSDFIKELNEENSIDELFGNENKIMNFILVDSQINVSNYEYDSWVTSNNISKQGIWVGDGINDQFIFKLNENPQYLRDTLSNSFGYIIKNGKTTQAKLLSNVEGDEDN